MEPFIGQVIMFTGNFAPRNWALCDGTLLSIQQNEALFSILGTTYGGDGRTTFALPDLRGRLPMHAGSGPGLIGRSLGQKGGSETHILTVNNLPPHNHTASGTVEPRCKNGSGDETNPNNAFPAVANTDLYADVPDSNTMGQSPVSITVGNTGGGESIDHMPPYLAVNYIIAMVGLYPSRN